MYCNVLALSASQNQLLLLCGILASISSGTGYSVHRVKAFSMLNVQLRRTVET